MPPISIMLVDDNKTFLRVMTEFLESHDDMQIVYASSDGREALAQAPRLRPQVVLADLAMPGMHGLEFIPRLREVLPETCIVALSVMDSQYFQSAARGVGADAFVSKSSVRTALVPAIRQLAHNGQAAANQPTDAKVKRDARRVLVMEDDPHLRNIYSRALESSGYTVYQAATLQQARELLTRIRFDVLLCDIQMGQERGTDLLQDCSEALFTSGAQVVVISGHGRYRDMCEEMGADFFLEKPVTLSTLVGLVNRITAQQGAAQPSP